jgi:phosphate-selective porin OprO/OprP
LVAVVTTLRLWGICPIVHAQTDPTNNPSPPPPQSAPVSPEGISLLSGDGQYQVRLRAYIHADARFIASEATGPANTVFLLRRVRPILEGRLFERFELRLMPDFGEGRTTLQDAFLDTRFNGLARLRAGKFKSPFGLERLISATNLLFGERAAPTSLAPNRDVGLMLHGESGRASLSYSIALVNGVPDGASADTDEGDGKDAVGRLALRPFSGSANPSLRPLMLAVAFSAGQEAGRPTAPALPQFRSAGQQVIFRFRNDGSLGGTAVANGERIRSSVQGQWHVGRVGILGEWTSSRQDVVMGDAEGEFSASGWMLTGAFSVYGRRGGAPGAVVPEEAFDPETGGRGAFEITGRATHLAIDDSVFPTFANPLVSVSSVFEWAVGVNWYLNRAVKFTTSFHQAQFERGAPQGDRPTERLVLSRIQFAF